MLSLVYSRILPCLVACVICCGYRCSRCRHVTSMTSEPGRMSTTVMTTMFMITGPTARQTTTVAAAAGAAIRPRRRKLTASLTLTFTASQDCVGHLHLCRRYEGQSTTEGRRHGADWLDASTPLLPEIVPMIDANPIEIFFRRGGGGGHVWSLVSPVYKMRGMRRICCFRSTSKS